MPERKHEPGSPGEWLSYIKNDLGQKRPGAGPDGRLARYHAPNAVLPCPAGGGKGIEGRPSQWKYRLPEHAQFTDPVGQDTIPDRNPARDRGRRPIDGLCGVVQ